MGSDSRVRLIKATRELLWERGLGGTSPRDIQARADVGQGSMYHHFAGKTALAAAALDATGSEMVRTGDAILGAGGPAADRIAAYLRRDRPVLRGCPIGRMTEDADAMASPELRAPVGRTLDWLRARMTAVLIEGQRSGELDPDLDAARTATAIVAGLQGAYVLAKAADASSVFDDAVEGVLGLLAAHIRARPAAATGAGSVRPDEESTTC